MNQLGLFDGIVNKQDSHRLTTQLDHIRSLMSDGVWRSVTEINQITGYPETSISAQLRNLRKSKFGGWTVNRRRWGNTYQFQLKGHRDAMQ